MSKDNKAAIITGASSGIGQATAKRLSERGYTTVLIARRKDRLQQLSNELSSFAPSIPVCLDLSIPNSIDTALRPVLDEFGPVEVVVNNAGFGCFEPFLEHSLEDHRSLMQVHYFAAVEMIRLILPQMLKNRCGHVINVASISTKVGPWGHSGYAAAKSALASLTQTLFAEYHQEGVHFTYVNPGIVRTEFFDQPAYQTLSSEVKRHGLSTQYVANKIVNLLDRPKLELILPPHYRLLDWFNLLCPSFVHKVLARRPASHKNTAPVAS